MIAQNVPEQGANPIEMQQNQRRRQGILCKKGNYVETTPPYCRVLLRMLHPHMIYRGQASILRDEEEWIFAIITTQNQSQPLYSDIVPD
mmetsp:Transcript_160/g.227  ORF Transcript_160/g.227 Transcript_160/m.227 type:complete len:89 (+) Transcript_160:241-507(+)